MRATLRLKSFHLVRDTDDGKVTGWEILTKSCERGLGNIPMIIVTVMP